MDEEHGGEAAPIELEASTPPPQRLERASQVLASKAAPSSGASRAFMEEAPEAMDARKGSLVPRATELDSSAFEDWKVVWDLFTSMLLLVDIEKIKHMDPLSQRRDIVFSFIQIDRFFELPPPSYPFVNLQLFS